MMIGFSKVLLAALLMAAALPANAFVPCSYASTKTLQCNNNKIHGRSPVEVIAPATIFSPPTATTSTALSLSGSEAEVSLSKSLLKLLLETVIVNGVPAVFTLIVIGFIGWQFRPRKDGDDDMEDSFGPPGRGNKKNNNPAAELYSDLYEGDETDKPMSPLSFFKMLKPPTTPASTNRGVPAQQFIKITNLNQKYDSYDFSLTAATQSKAKAAAMYRAKNFDRALRLGLNGAGTDDDGVNGSSSSTLSPFTKTTLLDLEKNFLKSGSKLLTVIQQAQAALTKNAIDEEMKQMGMGDPFELDPLVQHNNATNATTTNTTVASDTKKKGTSSSTTTRMADTMTQLAKAQTELMKLELDFIKDVVATLGTERATGIRTALVGDIEARGTGGLLTQLQDRPLSVLLNGGTTQQQHDEATGTTTNGAEAARRKSVFVTRFPGDTTASQVAELREEVTAIVRNAKPGDEAMVVLQTGGGTVTGYGLAAAQLLRFKDAGMKLTIAVEQVAASGGYMMCCVADKIVSSPFAVLGSIGVITDIPNVYERLKQEGIEFQTVTAGKYKRTITPTKRVTKEDFEKTKQDVEKILVLFKQFVAQNRPSLDIDEVATGETWFGQDALERGLTDEIKTADDVLTEYVNNGYDVYEVEYSPPDKSELKLAGVPGGSSDNGASGVFQRAIRWTVRTLMQEVKAELGQSVDLKQQQSPEKRYMMVDDSADRIRSEYK